MGLTVWNLRKIEFIRQGKKRRPEAIESPYLPNYIFAEIPAHRFLDVVGIKYLAKTLTPLTRCDLKALRAFSEVTAKEYDAAQRIKGNQDLISEYKAGQAVRLLDGRFADRLLTFKGVVERSFDLYPKIQMETEMFGRSVLVEADPLDVRRA